MDRVLDVLSAFALSKAEWRPAQLAQVLGMPRTTVLYVLRALVRRGVLEALDTGVYRLGFGFYKLAVGGLARYDFRAIALRVMQDAVRRCEETVYFCLYENGDLVFLDHVDGPNPIRYHPELTRSFSLHAGAAGKAVLAFLSEAEISSVLSKPLRQITPGTITDPDRLRADLARIRERGYAVSVGERVENAAGVAAPVIAPDGRPVGSLVVSMPIERFRREREGFFGTVMREAAQALSDGWRAHLGGRPGETPSYAPRPEARAT